MADRFHADVDYKLKSSAIRGRGVIVENSYARNIKDKSVGRTGYNR